MVTSDSPSGTVFGCTPSLDSCRNIIIGEGTSDDLGGGGVDMGFPGIHIAMCTSLKQGCRQDFSKGGVSL